MPAKSPFDDKRKLRYIGLKTGIVVERVDVKFIELRYRDAKGRLSKFHKGKRLSVEVVYERRLPHQRKWKRRVSTSYGLPLKKRTKPVSRTVIERQMLKRWKDKAKKGHTITAPERIEGLWVQVSYKYYEKQRKKKKGSMKHGRRKAKRHSM